MTKPITPEMSAAWRTLQAAAKGAYRLQPEVRKAINIIDNSDFMVPIEDAELETEHDRLKEAGYLVIKSGEALDPAEWGDTTRQDIAHRHGLSALDVNWGPGRPRTTEK